MDRRLLPQFLRLEHPASGGDINATALAKGAGNTSFPKDFLESQTSRTTMTFVAVGGIEWDEIDVALDSIKERGKTAGGIGRIVFPIDQSPLKENPFPGGLTIATARCHKSGEIPLFAYWD